jgi:hypothetical protein
MDFKKWNEARIGHMTALASGMFGEENRLYGADAYFSYIDWLNIQMLHGWNVSILKDKPISDILKMGDFLKKNLNRKISETEFTKLCININKL